MKKFKQALFLVILSLLVFTVSCQHMMDSQGASGDYYSGSNAGKDAAHEDVLHSHGELYRMSDTAAIRNNTIKHLQEMEGPVSEAYIKGFKWGYKKGFRDSVDTYNGGG